MRLFVIAWKDVVLLVRDRAALLFLVLVPIVVITIIAETQGDEGKPGIVLLVVNEDQGPVAEVLLESLRGRLKVREVDAAHAEQMVGGEHDAPAALFLPARLSKNYLAGLPSQLTLLTDPVKQIEVATIKAFLLLADREASTLADPLYEELLSLSERNATGSRLTIPQLELFVPGFSLMFTLMGVFFGVTLGLRDELDWGALTRLRIAPLPRGLLLGGKLLARFAVGVAQLWLLFIVGYLVWGVSLGRSPLAFALLIPAIVFSMTGFSLLIGAFARSREQIVPLGMTVVMVVCAIGGCWWPLYDAPPWLQQLAQVFLTTWAMEGLLDVMLREQGLVDVLPILGVLFAYGAICLVLGARFYRLES